MKIFRCLLFVFSLTLPLQLSGQSADFRVGVEAYQSGNFTEAIEWFDRLITTDYQSREVHLFLSASYLSKNLPVLAEFTAEAGLESFPDEATFIWLRAEAMLRQSRTEEARDEFRYLFRYYETLRFSNRFNLTENTIRQRWIDSELLLSANAYQRSDYEGAEESLETILRLNPGNRDAQKNKIYLNHRMEKWEIVTELADNYLEKWSDDMDVIRLKASAFYNLDDMSGLLDSYRIVYEENPSDIEAAEVYAQILLANEKGGEAEAVYLKLLEEYPDEKKVYLSFARLQEQRMYFAAKATILEAMVERFPDEKDAFRDLASTYEIKMEWEKARETWYRLAEIEGFSTLLYLKIVNTWLEEEQPEDAENVLRSALDSDTDDRLLIVKLGEVLQQQQKWEESLNFYRQLPEQLIRSSVGVQKAHALYKTGHMNESEQILQNLNRDGQSDPGSHLLMARITYPRDRTESFAHTRQAVQLGFETVSRRQSAISEELEREGLRAGLNFQDNDFEYLSKITEEALQFLTDRFAVDQADPFLRELTSHYRNSAVLMYVSALFYIGQNNIEMAENLLERALQVHSGYFEAHIAMGDIFISKGNYRQAIISYERALSIRPDSQSAYRKIIDSSRKEGTLNQLADRWLRQYRIRSENRLLREHLIEVLHRTDRFEEADSILAM